MFICWILNHSISIYRINKYVKFIYFNDINEIKVLLREEFVMENAAKALTMAASVLIAMVIISSVLLVFSEYCNQLFCFFI